MEKFYEKIPEKIKKNEKGGIIGTPSQSILFFMKIFAQDSLK